MALEHVTWVPDPGYNWVSFYANEKRGMSIERQKIFLKFFVAAAKEKLLKPNLKQISPELLKNFKLSAQFDRAGEADLSVIEPYSGARYVAAERFWIDEVREHASPGAAPKAGNAVSTSIARFVNRQLAEKLRSSYAVDFADLALACYGALLAKLSGRDEAIVVASLDEKEPFPLLFRTALNASFAEFALASVQKLKEARFHRLFAFFILTNPLRLKEFGCVCPSFRAGFLEADAPEITMAGRLEHYPAVNQQIDLLLRLTSDADGAAFEVSCPTGRYSQAESDRIAEGLMAALEVISTRADLKLDDLFLSCEAQQRTTAAASDQLAGLHATAQ